MRTPGRSLAQTLRGMASARSSFGPRAALAAALAAIAYGIPQVLQVIGVLPDPWDRVLIFAPSLLLAPSFVCAMAGAMQFADDSHRATALAAFGLAIMYAVLVSIVYVVQLGVVIPGELDGDPGIMTLSCCAPRMPMTAIDLLGYSLMSVSLWLLATVMPRGGALRSVLLLNGWLVFALLGQLVWPALIWVGAIWLLSFPAAMLLLRRRFDAQ